MKICYLTNNLDPKNGWGRYASDLIYGVKNSGHEVVILKEENDGFEGIPILKRGLGIFSSALKIRKFINDCDIIHALDGYPFGIIAWLANIGLNKKLVITIQGSYSIAPLYNWKISFLAKLAYKKANKIVAISNYTKNELLKKINLGNLNVINHGIDLKKFYGERIENEGKFILSVGALKFRKGYHILIPAFALAKKNIPDLKYKIVGSQEDKNYFNYLKKMIKEEKIENDVEFLDNLDDEELKKLYQKARLFILTSVNHGHHFEGFGLVFLEAAAAGLPVIGTRDNGIEDALKNGYNGLLAPQNDIEAASGAIVDLISNKDKWQQFSQNACFWAKEHNLDKTISEYINIYKKTINE